MINLATCYFIKFLPMKKTLSQSLALLSLITILSFTIPGFPVSARADKTVTGKDDKNDAKGKFQILFNENVGFTELVMISEHCAKNGIVLSYKIIEYNDDGKLKRLSFRVDCQDGFSGSASTDRLVDNIKFGFFRDYRKGVSTPFGVGAIPAEKK